MKFEFDGFTLVPYTRMTRGGKWVVPKAKKYIENQTQLGWLYKATMLENGWSILPARTPLYLRLVLVRPDLYVFDLDNCVKAALDAAQGIVLVDDRYIIQVEASKRRGSPRMEVEIGLVVKE